MIVRIVLGLLATTMCAHAVTPAPTWTRLALERAARGGDAQTLVAHCVEAPADCDIGRVAATLFIAVRDTPASAAPIARRLLAATGDDAEPALRIARQALALAGDAGPLRAATRTNAYTDDAWVLATTGDYTAAPVVLDALNDGDASVRCQASAFADPFLAPASPSRAAFAAALTRLLGDADRRAAVCGEAAFTRNRLRLDTPARNAMRSHIAALLASAAWTDQRRGANLALVWSVSLGLRDDLSAALVRVAATAEQGDLWSHANRAAVGVAVLAAPIRAADPQNEGEMEVELTGGTDAPRLVDVLRDEAYSPRWALLAADLDERDAVALAHALRGTGDAPKFEHLARRAKADASFPLRQALLARAADVSPASAADLFAAQWRIANAQQKTALAAAYPSLAKPAAAIWLDALRARDPWLRLAVLVNAGTRCGIDVPHGGADLATDGHLEKTLAAAQAALARCEARDVANALRASAR
jgi:hypothetical protein